MLERIRTRALLCALAIVLAGCDADQLQRGRLQEPDEPLGDAPAWVQEAIANQATAEKSKDKFRDGKAVQPEPKRRADVDYDQLDRPLAQVVDLRVRPLPAEPAPRIWRGDVPKKGERAVAIDQPDAVAVDLTALRQPGALQATAANNAVVADVVDLNSVAVRPLDQNLTPRTDIQTAPLSLNADGSIRVGAARQPVAAGGQVVAGVDSTVNADLVELPRVLLSRIENLYNSSMGLSRGRRLEQFGYKSFSGGPRVEANVPPDSDFILGPGDEIRIKSVDNFEFDKTLVVDRDGTLFIDKDNVGTIKVAGLKYKDLTETIRAAIARVKGQNRFTLDVALGKLHGIRVRVDGFVKAPGLQVLSGNATLTDLLLAAGGPTKDGTLRDIVIQRLGRPDIHVDLYSMLATGNTVADAVLLSGDRVYVAPIGPTAAVMGPAGSGIYELIDKTTLNKLMNYVGRITAFTQLGNVQIERTINNIRREIQSIDYTKQAASFSIQDGDVVVFERINTVVNDTVAVAGAVIKPSTYPYTPGMTVSDLIRKAGGFLLDASLEHAMISRPLGTPATFDIMPGDRAGNTREETISIDLAGILAGNKGADLPLRRLDTLKIFTHLESRDDATVKITGGVRKPGVYKLTANLTLGELIRLAGGPTSDAFPGESKIVRLKHSNNDMQMNVENYRFRLDDVLHRLADHDLLLENQDQIVIKRVQSMQVTVRIGGRVSFPGTYILPDGSKISTLLAEAGGLLPDADLRAAVFTRKKIQQFQQARLDDLFTRMDQAFGDGRNRVIRDGHNNEGIAAHLSYLGLSNLTNNIERFQARGRLVINMSSSCFIDSLDNQTLEDGDELYIPRRENIIMVLGECNYPNAFVWQNGMTVGDYIAKAGGILPEADRKQIYVVMSNGEVYSDSNKNMFGGNVAGFRPGPGDTVLIPKKAPSRSALNKASDITLLIRQMAETGLIGASIPQTFAPNHPANVNIGVNPSNQTPPDIINNNSSDQFYNDARQNQQQLLQQNLQQNLLQNQNLNANQNQTNR